MYPTSSKLIFRFLKKYQCSLNKKDWFLKVFQGHFLRPQLVMNLVDLQIKKPLLVQLTAQHIQVFHWQDTFYQQLKHGSFLSFKKISVLELFIIYFYFFQNVCGLYHMPLLHCISSQLSTRGLFSLRNYLQRFVKFQAALCCPHLYELCQCHQRVLRQSCLNQASLGRQIKPSPLNYILRHNIHHFCQSFSFWNYSTHYQHC